MTEGGGKATEAIDAQFQLRAAGFRPLICEVGLKGQIPDEPLAHIDQLVAPAGRLDAR